MEEIMIFALRKKKKKTRKYFGKRQEDAYIRPKLKLRFLMKRNSVYISFHCGRNETKSIFVLIF